MAENNEAVVNNEEAVVNGGESAVESVAPIDDAELTKLKNEMDKLKRQLSNANSQAAEYKRKFKEKMTEDERNEAERLEKEKARDEELALLRKEKMLSDYRSNLSSIGYDSETSARIADTLPEGLGEEFFAAQKEFFNNKMKQIEADAIKGQPNLSKGQPLSTKSAEEKAMADLRKWAGLK